MRNQQFILVADRSDGFVDTLKAELAATNLALLHAKNGEEAVYLLQLLEIRNRACNNRARTSAFERT